MLRPSTPGNIGVKEVADHSQVDPRPGKRQTFERDATTGTFIELPNRRVGCKLDSGKIRSRIQDMQGKAEALLANIGQRSKELRRIPGIQIAGIAFPLTKNRPKNQDA